MAILIVDDSEANSVPVAALLTSVGLGTLRTAQTAAKAFDILGLEKPRAESEDIAVILMDIVMPGMDGIEACRRIKAAPHLRDIPILMVTGQTEMDDLEAAFAAGAMDYITKPINSVELLTRVRSAYTLKQEMDARKNRERELLEVTKQLAEANIELERLSAIDGLTGIANRRHFDNFLARDWRRAARQQTPVSLIMLDIDHFKAFNDAYHHQAGDDCLKLVAGVFNQCLHRSDDLVARYGGEEFVVVLPDTELAGALSVAETLRERVENLHLSQPDDPLPRRVTISLGVASMIPDPDADSGYHELIASADRALYAAKQGGRNQVRAASVVKESVPV